MGTPPFAATILQGLLASSHHVVGVVTRPDSRKGRGRAQSPSAVAMLADERGIQCVKPESSSAPMLPESLKSWAPDVAAVAAFGLILTSELIAIPPRGCVNVHASLLPRYRGAAPIQHAIIDGETETGITTMLIDSGLDTGDMLLKRTVPIPPDMTAGELEEQLAQVGATVLVETLDAMESGRILPIPQDHSLATYARSLSPQAGDILFDESAKKTHDRIRGCTPRPGARGYLQANPLRIWRSALPSEHSQPVAVTPGTVLTAGHEGITVACGDGLPIMLCEVQPAGKARMRAADYARGARLAAGVRFDSEVPSR